MPIAVRSIKNKGIKIFIFTDSSLIFFTFFCWSQFLTYIIFLPSKDFFFFFYISCKTGLLGNRFLQFWFVCESFLSLALLKDNFKGYRNLSWRFFCFVLFSSKNSEYFTPLSCLQSFWDVGCNPYLCSSVGKVLFFSGFFQDFFFIFDFLIVWRWYAHM